MDTNNTNQPNNSYDEHSLEFAQTLKTIEDFQKFIDSHPEINEGIDLKKNFFHVYRRYYGLRSQGKIKKTHKINYKVKKFDWSSYNTFEDFQKFIDENKIVSSTDFKNKYGGLAKRANRLKIKIGSFKYHKELNFKRKHRRSNRKISSVWSNYNTTEDFQKFIDENKIETAEVFRKKYGGLTRRASRLNIKISDLKYHIEGFHDLISSANLFMNENHICSLKELEDKYPDKYLEFYPVKKYIKYYSKNTKWSKYNTIEEIQKFINNNNIESRMEFRSNYPGLYYRCSSINGLDQLIFKKDMPTIKYKIKQRFKTLNDIYNYLDKNKITKSSQLISTEEGRSIYYHAINKNWRIEFSEKPNDFSVYNTTEDFQKFIDENNIKSANEFRIYHSGIYNRLCKLKLNKKVKYLEYPRKSFLEIRVAKELDKLGIEYLEQETFPDLRDKALLKIDFIIESKKLILEPGGMQHLALCGFIDEEKFKILQKHDKMKREYCINKGYTVLYLFRNDHTNLFSNEEFIRLVNEYPGESYTYENIDQFFDRIVSM